MLIQRVTKLTLCSDQVILSSQDDKNVKQNGRSRDIHHGPLLNCRMNPVFTQDIYDCSLQCHCGWVAIITSY